MMTARSAEIHWNPPRENHDFRWISSRVPQMTENSYVFLANPSASWEPHEPSQNHHSALNDPKSASNVSKKAQNHVFVANPSASWEPFEPKRSHDSALNEPIMAWIDRNRLKQRFSGWYCSIHGSPQNPGETFLWAESPQTCLKRREKAQNHASVANSCASWDPFSKTMILPEMNQKVPERRTFQTQVRPWFCPEWPKKCPQWAKSVQNYVFLANSVGSMEVLTARQKDDSALNNPNMPEMTENRRKQSCLG